MNPVLVAFVFFRVTEVDWYPSGGFNVFIAYELTTSTVES